MEYIKVLWMLQYRSIQIKWVKVFMTTPLIERMAPLFKAWTRMAQLTWTLMAMGLKGT